MADNDTKIRITAVDEVTKTLNSISNATKGLTGDFGKLGGALAAIGVTGALAGVAAMVKGAIDAAASMGDLSQKTGIAVKELTALDYAMRREGASTEAFAKGIKELSKNLTEAGDATSKAGKLFQILGVDANGGPREALLKIADAFQALPDGATKATLAAELFGKAGLDLIPALNNGAKGIREIEAEAERLGITFGDEAAKGAKEFSDKMFALEESTKSLGIALAKEVLPGLNNIATAMKAAAEESGLLEAALVGIGGVMYELFNGNEARNLEKEIAKVRSEIASLAEQSAMNSGNYTVLAWLNKQAAEADKRLADLIVKQKEFNKATTKPGEFVGPPSPAASEMARRLREELAGKKPPAAVAADPAKNLLISLQQEYTKLNSITKENETLERVLGELKKDSYTNSAKGLKAQIEAEARLIDALKKRLATEQFLAALNQKDIDAAEQRGKALEAISNQWAEGTEQLEEELELLGLTNLQREKAILQKKALADITAAGDSPQAVRDINAALAAQLATLDKIHLKNLDIVAVQQAQADQASVWDEISSRGANFFVDLAESGKDAFKSLRASLKDFLRELIAMFAKKWILQLGAGLTGSAGLAAQAAGVGQGTLAGAAGDMLGAGLTGATGLAFTGAGLSQGFGLAAANIGTAGYFGGFGANAALASSSLSAGSIGTAVGAMMPYLLPLLGVAALAMAFRDKGENWKGRIGFGDGASAYTSDGVFGREGFQYIAGNDATNRSLQAFMASTKPLDQQLAAGLSPAQLAAITGSLAAYNASGARRADGQPAEFAFGKGDETAAQQLTLEYLQQKYGAVFDEIDGTFAEFIRDYTGKSEDLLKEIGAFAAVLDGLREMNINGLDAEGLRGFQRAGETIEQTFQRVGGSWQEFERLFTTDAERLQTAKDLISDAFKDLNIAVPSTKDEFESLVRGLDLSTEAGRTMFTTLMDIAPAFAAVADAAESALGSMAAIARSTGPLLGFSRTGSNTSLNLTPSINQLTNSVRENTDATEANTDSNFSGVYGLTPEQRARLAADEAARRAAEDLAAAFKDAKASLADYLTGLLTSDLSPLSERAQFDLAKNDFASLLKAAMGGDITALQKLTGASDALLRLGRELFGSSSEYVSLFESVFDSLADVADVPDYNERMLEAQDKHLEVSADMLNMLIRIRDDGPTHAAAVVDAVNAVAAALRSTVDVTPGDR